MLLNNDWTMEAGMNTEEGKKGKLTLCNFVEIIPICVLKSHISGPCIRILSLKFVFKMEDLDSGEYFFFGKFKTQT